MTTAQLLHLIRTHLKQLPTKSADTPAAIAPGDIVQLKPDADPTFGGMLLRVTTSTAHRVEGYFLTPHRTGCREAWYRFPHSCVSPIGSLVHPEAAWSFRGLGAAAPCPTCSEALQQPQRKEPQRALSALRLSPRARNGSTD